MRRDYHSWYSHRLNRNMELLVYGESGLPVLVFPTLQGRFFEYENSGMIEALSQKIDWGHLQVFCADSVDSESWNNHGVHPHTRVTRHVEYENYILFEVLPLMKGVNGAQQIFTTGCSFGAYHALNFAMKHPEETSGCVAMSGEFDLRKFMDGYYDTDFYFNNPFDYLPNMQDTWYLERYRKMKLVLAVGERDDRLEESLRMDQILKSKEIPHLLDVWSGNERGDWPLWQRMAAKFF